MGSKVYVVAGENSTYSLVNSIEMLDITKKERGWHLFNVYGLTERRLPAVCMINDKDFVVMGGFDQEEYLSDVLVVDTTTLTGS